MQWICFAENSRSWKDQRENQSKVIDLLRSFRKQWKQNLFDFSQSRPYSIFNIYRVNTSRNRQLSAIANIVVYVRTGYRYSPAKSVVSVFLEFSTIDLCYVPSPSFSPALFFRVFYFISSFRLTRKLFSPESFLSPEHESSKSWRLDSENWSMKRDVWESKRE